MNYYEPLNSKYKKDPLSFSSSQITCSNFSCFTKPKRSFLFRTLTSLSTWITAIITLFLTSIYFQSELAKIQAENCLYCSQQFSNNIEIRNHGHQELNFASSEKHAILSDFKRTKNIVLNELHSLQSNRSKLVSDIREYQVQKAELDKLIDDFNSEKQALLRQIEVLKLEKEKIKKQKVKEIIPIAGKVVQSSTDFIKLSSSSIPKSSELFSKTFNENFDFSRCPIFGGFVTIGDQACVFLQESSQKSSTSSSQIFKNSNFITFSTQNSLSTAAVRASPEFKVHNKFRQNYDIIIPDNFEDDDNSNSILSANVVTSEIQTPPIPFSPAYRKKLLAFCDNTDFLDKNENQFIHSKLLKLLSIENEDILQLGDSTINSINIFSGHTFMLIPAYSGYTSSTNFQKCLRLSLQHGTIPVILKLNNDYSLPFDEFVNYQKSTITIPIQRHPELIEILNKLNPEDIHKLRRTGFFQYSTYFKNGKIIKRIILNVIRQRLNIPQTPMDETLLAGDLVEHQSYPLPPGFPHLKVYNLDKEILEELENVPRESKRNSLINYANYSSQFLDVERIWNEVPGPAQYKKLKK